MGDWVTTRRLTWQHFEGLNFGLTVRYRDPTMTLTRRQQSTLSVPGPVRAAASATRINRPMPLRGEPNPLKSTKPNMGQAPLIMRWRRPFTINQPFSQHACREGEGLGVTLDELNNSKPGVHSSSSRLNIGLLFPFDLLIPPLLLLNELIVITMQSTTKPQSFFPHALGEHSTPLSRSSTKKPYTFHCVTFATRELLGRAHEACISGAGVLSYYSSVIIRIGSMLPIRLFLGISTSPFGQSNRSEEEYICCQVGAGGGHPLSIIYPCPCDLSGHSYCTMRAGSMSKLQLLFATEVNLKGILDFCIQFPRDQSHNGYTSKRGLCRPKRSGTLNMSCGIMGLSVSDSDTAERVNEMLGSVSLLKVQIDPPPFALRAILALGGGCATVGFVGPAV
ncbi:unnamed protein product [Protopolystoma xenopodis]|uniref:Uncharacterized protein n=1 Tax=Protopolystoma xenopodis TaxID=117903 RepID=A0A3S4ZB21_9PLAT|nr:unnamed protein product [Protopolystoma xenopodis]